MKLEINVNKDERNERIVIYAQEITADLQQMIEHIERIIHETKLYGKRDGAIYPLQHEKIVRFYTENKQLIAEDLKQTYVIDKRLYELEQLLPRQFIRISQSEIINIRYIKKLKQEINGFIKIYFTHGVTTYSSRRYVKMIKEALQL